MGTEVRQEKGRAGIAAGAVPGLFNRNIPGPPGKDSLDPAEAQSEKFCLNYDANSLLYISKAMDMFDLSADSLLALQQTSLQVKDRIQHVATHDQLTAGLALLKSIPTLVLGVQSDILFPCWQQKEISDCLRKAGNPRVHYYELDAMYGHDTFLIDLNAVGPAIKGHLEHDNAVVN